jgi:phosphonate transport system substrate-binding protein
MTTGFSRLGALVASFVVASAACSGAIAANAADCPNDGVVRFGVEPYEATARLVPIYDHIAKAISDKLGCEIKIFITTSYTSEVEAMRNGKLEAGEFGPFSYVLAHEVAKAEAVATFGNKENKPDTYWASIVTWPGSGIKSVADIKGHSFAFSDAASTSGYLYPSYGLRKAGLDPKADVRGILAGSHTSSFEALYNHKVDAGELNSAQIDSAKERGHYKDGDFIFLWKSEPIPVDPICIRADLPDGFKKRLVEVLQNVDLSTLPEADKKIIGFGGTRLVPTNDSAFNGIRDLVKTLNIDLKKLNS